MQNPEIVKELKRLAKKNGGVLEPARVVEAARESASPLHSQFEWDDSEAAQRYRLWQARQLIRITVEFLPSADRVTDVFVSLTSDRTKGGYRTTVDVLSDDAMREQLLSDALEELDRWKRQYKELRELVKIFEAIEVTRATVPIAKEARA